MSVLGKIRIQVLERMFVHVQADLTSLSNRLTEELLKSDKNEVIKRTSILKMKWKIDSGSQAIRDAELCDPLSIAKGGDEWLIKGDWQDTA